MWKAFFLCLTFIFTINTFAQNIEVSLKNSSGAELIDINVQLLKDGSVLDFKKTNQQGICIFQRAETGVFSLKFTSLYYKTKIVEIDTNKQNSFNFVLEPQITEIENVEIKARPKIAFQKKDTISFNIKSVQDGTERTAEDLIKKIPGLDINDAGKVTFKGKQLGQILIDGNEFFGKNQKIATQNISADMLEGIDLWENYTKINDGKSTALNLKLKDGYRGKITGDVKTLGGTNNNYLIHSNLFKFNKIGNFALITDFNNVAKDPLNFMDFYDMNSQDDVSNSPSNQDMQAPSFLNNDGKVKKKDNQFAAFQYSKNSKNFRISAFSVLDASQLIRQNFTNRFIINSNNSVINYLENSRQDNKGLFGTTNIKMRQNFNDHSFLYYSFQYNPTTDKASQNINRFLNDSIFYGISQKNRKNVVGNFLSWNKNLKNNLNLVVAANTKHILDSENLSINSNVNLFNLNSDSLNQNYKEKSNSYGLDFYLSNKTKFFNYTLQTGFSKSDNSANLTQEVTKNKNLYKTFNYLNSVLLSKKIGRFDFSGKLEYNKMEINNVSKNYLNKNFSIHYKPEEKIGEEYNLEYNDRYSPASVLILQENPFYTNLLGYSQNVNIMPLDLVNQKQLRFTYNRFNFTKGNFNLLVVEYNFSDQLFTQNYFNFPQYSIIKNQIGNFDRKYLIYYNNNQRLSKNYRLSSKLTGFQSNNKNLITGNENRSKIQSLKLEQKISSTNQDFPFQFDFGYTYLKTKMQQSYQNTSASQEQYNLLLNLKTTINKEWIGNLSGNYLVQKTSFQTRNNFLLNGEVTYQKIKSNFEYNLTFSNLLHLNNFDYIENNNTPLGNDQVVISSLRGYVIAGFKYKFN